ATRAPVGGLQSPRPFLVFSFPRSPCECPPRRSASNAFLSGHQSPTALPPSTGEGLDTQSVSGLKKFAGEKVSPKSTLSLGRLSRQPYRDVPRFRSRCGAAEALARGIHRKVS